jgi:hypothetical protein
VVHFGPEELLRECLNTTTCECQCWSVNDSETKTGTMDIALLGHKTGVNSTLRRVNMQWRNIVQRYSKKKLKFEGDIFPALQGIAKVFSKVKGCAYYAGLWEDTLVEDLIWHRSPFTPPGVRPQTWRAPSWSWASIKGPVFYWNKKEGFKTIYVTVLSVEVTPVGSDSFGEIADATLTLAGSAVPVTLDCSSGRCYLAYQDEHTKALPSEHTNSGTSKRESFEQDYNLHFDQDYDLRPFDGSQIWVLKMAEGASTSFFLVLRQVDEETQIFERVGIWIRYFYADIDGRIVRYLEDNACPLTVTII